MSEDARGYPGGSMNETAGIGFFRGGSDHCGPCKECLEEGRYVPMAYHDWDKKGHPLLFGDQDITGFYKCEFNHVVPVKYATTLQPPNEKGT